MDVIIMKCLICGNEQLEYTDTIVSSFVMARISDSFEEGSNTKTRLCYCPKCTFAFYEYRMTDDEQSRLYLNYRDKNYQELREKYECWYTKKVNNALNNDTLALHEQQRVIEAIIAKNMKTKPVSVLDWGGNEGKTLTPAMGSEKYVYDISCVPTVEGVTGLSSFEEVKKRHYDLILCNMLFEHVSDPLGLLRQLKELSGDGTYFYIEVPSETPFKTNKFSISQNLRLLVNPIHSKTRLIRYYFKRRKLPFMPMAEHINFFTAESLRAMVENAGFTILDLQENTEKCVLGKSTVLSVLFV